MAGSLSRRGDLVTIALPGEYGKPRPALAVRADQFPALPSISVRPLTTTLRDDIRILRPTVKPNAANGLRRRSQILVDKVSTVPQSKVGAIVGRLDDDVMARVSRALAVYLAVV